MRLADPDDPNAGLVFRGRLAEDFKLTTGTFVRVGAVRTALLSAAPLLADAVIAGEDRAYAARWPGSTRPRRDGSWPAPAEGELISDPDLAAWPGPGRHNRPRARRPGSSGWSC